MDSFRNLEDETFPSLLSNASLGSSGRATLGDVTLGSALGVPVAASTVAKSRTAANRLTDIQASYLDDASPGLTCSQPLPGERAKFALSFKDDLDEAGNFIAANQFADLLVKVDLDESECIPTFKTSAPSRPSDYPEDISTGLLTFSHIGAKENAAAQTLSVPEIIQEESPVSEAADSDGMSGSVASFLANEKLLSLDSMNSDITDDEIDLENLHDEELKLYFNKLIPPGMQRGQVEGQEISVSDLPSTQTASSHSYPPEPTTSFNARSNFLNSYDERNFCMPDVRLAATGMDSCPASDEDTEDELEAARNHSTTRFPLPSTSRQPVGESNRPHFRPGLEGGSSDDEPSLRPSGSRTGIEHRRSAEGQVIDSPVTGDGGGGDGSSGSEEDGVSTVPLPAGVQTTYDVLRGLGIVGGSGTGEDEEMLAELPGFGRFTSTERSQMGDRVGPVGTVETETFAQSSAPQDGQEDQDAVSSSHPDEASPDELLDSVYLRSAPHLQDSAFSSSGHQASRSSFHLSFSRDNFHTTDPHALGFRGGPCGDSASLVQPPDSGGEHAGESLEDKYLSRSLHRNEEEVSDIWNHRPDDVPLEFQQDASSTNSVVYQNEEGKWVTDLAYYSSFEKEANLPEEVAVQFQSEEFIGGGQAMEKIIEYQNEFEKENQFMQEEKIEAVNGSALLGDTSWKCSSSVLMRASQAASDFEKRNQSYLRISLGEFFQQRSEALGCLGSSDYVKRPSFGYIINSPEKREPFALIRPSDFSSRGSSAHGDTDDTMNPEDLEKTLETTPSQQPPQSFPQPKDSTISPLSQAGSSCASSRGSLALSAIASAIADASVSSDPAQLAAMIMELSKQSRTNGEPKPPGHHKRTPLQDTLQKSSSPGEASTLDMEKYLKLAEVSGSDSDASSSRSCLDVLSLADSLAGEASRTVAHEESDLPSNHASRPADLSEVKRSDTKRSSIPRPKSSGIPTAAAHPARRSVAPTRSSLKPPPPPEGSQGDQRSVTKSPGRRSSFGSGLKTGAARPLVSGTSAAVKSNDSVPNPRTSPGVRNAGRRSKSSTGERAETQKISQASGEEKNSFQSAQAAFASPERGVSGTVEASHCSFRPSTSPLTHSSPSQTSLPSGYGDSSPSSAGGAVERSPGTEPLSPQSHCSSPSISRLTYLSINENTLLPTPDHHKNNNSMSLSTTIIRASPTPPSDSHELLGHNDAPSSPVHDNHTHQKDSRKRHSEPRLGLYTRVDSGYSSNLNIHHQSGGGTDPDTNAPPDASGTCGEAFSGSHYALPHPYKSERPAYPLVPNYGSQNALPDSVAALLSGRPLLNAQLPQQAPSYHLAPLSGAFGLPTAMTSNPASLTSGYVSTAPHPHHYPLETFGQSGVGAWPDLRTQVVVPDELKFPGSCCVGIACQTSLSIFNPSERWQQVAISVINLSIDGEKVDSLPYQWLIVKHKTIIGPKSTEEQKVLLIAPRAGLYQCTLSVSSWPASAESEAVAHAEAFAKKVVLIAVAENPAIEVDVGKTRCLDFGDLAGGGVKSLPLKLVNRTRATVPVRLVISANASAWHCFSLSKSPVALTEDGTLHPGGNQPCVSVINHVMHSSCGDNPDSFMVWIHYNAPQRFSSTNSGDLGPAEEFAARVDVEVDSPGPSRVIQSVGLRARSGTARVHAPKDMQTLCFRSLPGQAASQSLPLKNAGNIDVHLKLKSTDGDDGFTVKPDELFLRTGEEQSIMVTFTPQGGRTQGKSLLTILVLPGGPQYEVVLQGDVLQDGRGNVPAVPLTLPQSDVPPILSNKQFMAWGGVTLGRAVQQKLVLRNDSASTSQPLRLLIRGQDQDCFQLQSSFGPDERLTRSRELVIKPKEDVAVHLLFAPTRVAAMLAKLEIKQSAVRASQPGVKFTIPLSGYGGTSNIILEDVRKRSEGYVATLSGIQSGRVSKLCVCVRNTGSRAAFIRAVPYGDLEKRTRVDSTVISLSPSQFILKERTQEVITVVLKASCREQLLCQSHAALLATVCFFCGDEVSRQQFRKLLSIKPDAGTKVLSENSLLKSISFDEPFLGEELVHEAYDLPQRPNEAQIFYGNMSKVLLSLLGTVGTSGPGESDPVELVGSSQTQAIDSDSVSGTSGRHFSNVSLDVLPVKGPPLRVSEVVTKQTEPAVENSWHVQPEQLLLTAPSINGAADTRHVRLLNRTNRELSFELSWPAHCLTITPQHGVIEPQSYLQILISPNPSLATKPSLLPWSGQIYVQCDDQQKFVRVQIRQDVAMDTSTGGPSSERPLCPLPPQSATPVGSGLKPQLTSPQGRVEIRNRTLVFPPTCSGESSECLLEVENNGEEVRWYLSSFAPPYVKGVDGSGDVYRATYTAFRCEKMSGILGLNEKLQVPVTFLPRDSGDYAQFWDLECHPVSKPQQKSRTRFQLCGTGVRAGPGLVHKEQRTLVRTEANVKSRRRVEPAGTKTNPDPPRRGVYAPQSLYTFPAVRVGEVSTLKVNFRNNSSNTHELRFLSPAEPFHIKHAKYSLRTQHYINLPVQFKPSAVGRFSSSLQVQTDADVKLCVELSGEALP